MVRQVTGGHEMLRVSEHAAKAPEPTHDVHALGMDGESLFICASAWDEEEAQRDLERVLSDPECWPDNVDDYEIRKR